MRWLWRLQQPRRSKSRGAVRHAATLDEGRQLGLGVGGRPSDLIVFVGIVLHQIAHAVLAPSAPPADGRGAPRLLTRSRRPSAASVIRTDRAQPSQRTSIPTSSRRAVLWCPQGGQRKRTNSMRDLGLTCGKALPVRRSRYCGSFFSSSSAVLASLVPGYLSMIFR